VILAPALATALRQHWLASRHKGPSDFVFANPSARALNYRHVGDAFRRAVNAAELHAPGKLILHSLRHTFASFLIASGLDVVFVSRQLGHAHPGITLEVYWHLFAASATTPPARVRRSTPRTQQSTAHRRRRGPLMWKRLWKQTTRPRHEGGPLRGLLHAVWS
jgi:integrase